MIIFQWRPPWKRLTAVCNEVAVTTATTAKGKGRAIACDCQQVPARHASAWVGASSSSGAGSIIHSSDIGFLFFYPSYHHDVESRNAPILKPRHAKLLRRAIRRTLGPLRPSFQLPAISITSHSFDSDRNLPAYRHASHSSASTSQYQHQHESVQPFQSDQLPANVPLQPQADRSHFLPQSSASSSLQNTSVSPAATASTSSALPLPGTRIEVTQQDEAYVRLILAAFDSIYERLCESLGARAPTRQIRRRYLALLRLLSRIPKRIPDRRNHVTRVLGKVCAAHLRYNEADHLQNIVDRTEDHICREGFSLGPAVYNILIQAYGRAARPDQALAVLERMQEQSIGRDAYTYTNLISMYGQLKDPENARRTLEEMNRARLQVPQAAYTSLMNACVEAGFWDDAIDVFEFLDSHRAGHKLKPDLYTCTTLMKCYVLMGAPLAETMKLFNAMIQRGIKPSSKTFVLVLHAACSAGAIDFAEEVFARLDANDSKAVNAYVFTVMIGGMLRAGKQDVAMQYYQEMESRAIEPTSATWSVILNAAASSGQGDSNDSLTTLLEKYLDSYVDQRTGGVKPKLYLEDKSVARGTALENVFGPVLSHIAKGTRLPLLQDAAATSAKSGTAEARHIGTSAAAIDMFRSMLELPGAKPSLHLYTALLDAYRRAETVEGAAQIWPHIVQFALKIASGTVNEDGTDSIQDQGYSQVAASRRNLLCLPLSIYIDLMSRHHEHQKVAAAWVEVQKLGFGFDVGNWNHLISAFLRAGELERAFWTAEELLKEARRLADDNVPKLETHSTPYSSSQEDDIDSAEDYLTRQKAETPMRPPNRTWQYHLLKKRRLYEDRNYHPRIEQDMFNVRSRTSLEEIAQPNHPAQSHEASVAGHDNSTVVTLQPSTPDSADQHLSFESLSESMTADYANLRAQHKASTWHLFRSTLKMLEETLKRSQTSQAMQRKLPEEGKLEAQETVLTEQALASRYTLVAAAVASYRVQMRAMGLRAFT